MELHYKCSIWAQIKFDDTAVDEEQLIKDLESGIHPNDLELNNMEWKFMTDTEEQLTPDNNGQSTIKLMKADDPEGWMLKPIWTNEIKKDEIQS
jgi:hypothetical protein